MERGFVDEADVLSRLSEGQLNSRLKSLAADFGDEVASSHLPPLRLWRNHRVLHRETFCILVPES